METTLATHPMVRPKRRQNAAQSPNYIFVSGDGKSGWHYWCEGEEMQPRFKAIENFNIDNVSGSYSIIRMADLVPLLPI